MNTVSLELAKTLKEKGYPQKGEFYYIDDEYGYRYSYGKVSFESMKKKLKDLVVFAPISDEILDLLPRRIGDDDDIYYICIESGYNNTNWVIIYKNLDNQSDAREYGGTLADAAAKMWIYLKKNNLLGVK